MEFYTVTYVFGLDHIKTRIFDKKTAAIEDIKSQLRKFFDDISVATVIEKNNETYYIVSESDDPTEYIEFILRRCEVIHA